MVNCPPSKGIGPGFSSWDAAWSVTPCPAAGWSDAAGAWVCAFAPTMARRIATEAQAPARSERVMTVPPFSRHEPGRQWPGLSILKLSRSGPGAQLGVLLLERSDGASLLHGQPDIVEAVQEEMELEIVEIELDHAAIRAADFLGLEVDRQRGVRAARGVVHQLVQVFRADSDRQDAVLEAIVVENVGERVRDHAANAEIEQRPRRMLAARAAAEIVAGDQDLRLAISGFVEHEIRVFRTVFLVAHLGEQAGAKPGALDRLQIILR